VLVRRRRVQLEQRLAARRLTYWLASSPTGRLAVVVEHRGGAMSTTGWIILIVVLIVVFGGGFGWSRRR
jgi:hypothetical protein